MPLLTKTIVCNDIGKVSALHQTSVLEAFHSDIVHFAPVSTGFSYQGMLCRYGRHQKIFPLCSRSTAVPWHVRNCSITVGIHSCSPVYSIRRKYGVSTHM